MCGLVGIAGDLTFEAQSKVFRDLLDVCQTRGRDSTGVIKVDRQLNYDWVKQVGPPSILCDSRMYEHRIERVLAGALIGHCRSKTIGDATIKNAHPFDYPDDGICGVHNGTLRSYAWMDTHQVGKVDSEVLFGHLAKNGPEETFPLIEGAYACVWWNDKEKTLNFIRNDQRPLWFTWSEDKKMMFWASEIWMFGAVARKIKLWEGGEDKKPYIEMPIHTLWSFRLNPMAKKDEATVIMAPPKELKPKERTGGRNHYYYQDWERGEDGHYTRTPHLPASRGNNAANSQNSSEPKNSEGGEVPNPFRYNRIAGQGIDPTWNDYLDGDFDDDLPVELLPQGQAPTDSTNSNLCNVSFLRQSVTKSDSTTEQKSSTTSERPTLSLTDQSSRQSRRKTKGEPSIDSEDSSGNILNLTQRGVSLRTLVGVKYISSRKTHREWSSQDFYQNTGGCCFFCKDKVMSLEDVAEIIDDDGKSFICKPCLVEPKETTRLLKPSRKGNRAFA